VISFDAADTSYVSVDAAADAAACQSACNTASSCMFYAWDNTASKCYLASEVAGTARLGFKSASGVFNAGKYTVFTWDAAKTIGAPLTDPATASAATSDACTSVCDNHDECIAVVFDSASSSCTLVQADMDQDVTACQYKAEGQRMNVW
jgi:hypothetical protein